MTRHATIDATDIPELRRIVKEVREAREPVVVRLADEDVAMLMPMTGSKRSSSGKPSQAQIDSVMSAAGSWDGLVDVDELKAMWKAARGSNRPPIDL